MIVKDLDLEQVKSATTPSENGEDSDASECDADHTTRFKAFVARAHYFAPDRPDTQFP